ncbi:MAG: efflux transporter outer membrane subunit [Thiomonas arsenitoxydans]|uniref:Efflux transporter outer membrane subunit n=1 Tax=Thiomonas arsenitoxydans (strain DSM 22701 / CIP 110005 / 3As) TaxID=426114 RepID=A0A8I1MSX7_THIA3|nr:MULTISPECIES: efflux transporter outer membrane subunit [Thiomonas]MBN8743235.1 efflux transporter outer membrane subunit [Thiomonas arsenitoxydans]ODU98880.1 MAG: RND transporter [Thiomonas sp. SCN 64-16]
MKTIVLPRLSLAVPLVLTLAACAATPPEAPVKIALPASYAQAQSGWEPAQAMAAAPRGAWWSVFDDPVLAGLETQVAQHNQSLAAQLAAYEQAQAAVAQARAAYYPAVTAGASANRARTAGNGAVGNSLSASLGASWEPDLWGKVRLQVQAGQATAAASAATLANTQLSLQSTLATSYLQLRTVDAQIVLAQNTVAAYQRALQITDNRYKAGVGTAADVASARTQLLQAQTSLTDLGVTRVQLQNAIAVLVGKPPAEFSLPASDTLPEVPAIPAGIPAQLLQRRPDLAAAQAQVQAANAQIGVAQTAWFPNLTLSAQGGSQAARIAELFSAPSLFWSIGPQLAATLFDGGLRRAQEQSSQAAYRQTVANYRQSVLTALQQVEDNLAAQRILALEAQQQAEVVQAAEVSLRLAENQYKAGTAPYLNVITAQTTATSARNAQLTLLNRRYAASVSLIQALGGGWGAANAPAIGPLSAASAGAQ